MNNKLRILGVSDVSVGFGSPQIPALMKSLVDYYDKAEGILIEPDQPEKPPKNELFPEFKIKRIHTSSHPHSSLGRIEFNNLTAKLINELKPDILVIYCTYNLSVLFKLKNRPKFVLYYLVESPQAYGKLDIDMNRHLKGRVDLMIYPDDNRVIKDIQLCGYREIPYVVIYNCTDSKDDKKRICEPLNRNGRLIYSGTIEKERTFADYYLSSKMQSIPIDIFGMITGGSKEETKHSFQGLTGTIRYRGFVDNAILSEVRKAYAYSIVMWNPIDAQHLYAAPNKFYESIADGVPPITAPHPQCKMFVDKYKCGIVMKDWSFDSFYRAITRALKIYGSDKYQEMVNSCQEAFIRELNWKEQFEKVKPFLRRF